MVSEIPESLSYNERAAPPKPLSGSLILKPVIRVF